MATAPPAAPITVDRSDAGATTSLYRAAVGAVNTDYYQSRFSRFEAADRASPSWNWAASLLTLNWMVFRQLWSAALVYCGALVGGALLLFGIGRLVFQFPPETEQALLAAFVAAAVLLPGLYGNAIYHAHCRKRMAAALAAHTTLPEACAMLSRQASTRNRLIWLMLANMTVLALIAGAYKLLPETGVLPTHDSEARNVVVGRTTDASTLPAVAASAPVAAASAPQPAASAALGTASAPVAAASSPAVAAPQLAASAPVQAASAPAHAASAPIPIAKPTKAVATKPATGSASAPSTSKPTHQPAAKAKASPTAKSASAPAVAASKTPPAVQRYYINVGLFAQEANARKAHTTLQDAGITAFTQEFKTPKGLRIRVRAGPYDSQAEADSAAEKIRALGLDAIPFSQ